MGADTAEMKTIIKDALDKGIFDLDEFLAYIVSEELDEEVTTIIDRLRRELLEEELQ